MGRGSEWRHSPHDGTRYSLSACPQTGHSHDTVRIPQPGVAPLTDRTDYDRIPHPATSSHSPRGSSCSPFRSLPAHCPEPECRHSPLGGMRYSPSAYPQTGHSRDTAHTPPPGVGPLTDRTGCGRTPHQATSSHSPHGSSCSSSRSPPERGVGSAWRHSPHDGTRYSLSTFPQTGHSHDTVHTPPPGAGRLADRTDCGQTPHPATSSHSPRGSSCSSSRSLPARGAGPEYRHSPRDDTRYSPSACPQTGHSRGTAHTPPPGVGPLTDRTDCGQTPHPATSSHSPRDS